MIGFDTLYPRRAKIEIRFCPVEINEESSEPRQAIQAAQIVEIESVHMSISELRALAFCSKTKNTLRQKNGTAECNLISTSYDGNFQHFQTKR